MERYEIVERIGAGGMAEVYLARHLGIAGFRRNVALKRLRADSDEQRFIDEARISAQLAHPNIVQIYDFGRDEHGLFIAMEYVAGTSLANVQTIPREVAVHVIAELARGLDHAHRARDVDGTPLHIVHRDLSPHNVLVSRSGEVKLADFGIARAANQQSRTAPGSVAGKLGYMAPEQLAGAAVDGRADVFSLGVMLWELTLGRSAFETTARTSRDWIGPPSTVDPGYPAALDQIVRAAVSPDPEGRPTAAQLARQLDDYLASSNAAIRREHVAALIDGGAAPSRGPATVVTAIRAIGIGSQIGDYEVTRRLGEGGMGIVFAGIDRRIGKHAAIKLLRPQFAGDSKAVSRFLEEARAVNRIGSPNIVDIFGFGTLDDGAVYCVMELLSGKNLRELLHERGPLPLKTQRHRDRSGPRDRRRHRRGCCLGLRSRAAETRRRARRCVERRGRRGSRCRSRAADRRCHARCTIR